MNLLSGHVADLSTPKAENFTFALDEKPRTADVHTRDEAGIVIESDGDASGIFTCRCEVF